MTSAGLLYIGIQSRGTTIAFRGKGWGWGGGGGSGGAGFGLGLGFGLRLHGVDARVQCPSPARRMPDIINTMRNNYAKMTHFFGHPCIDFRQHIRVTLQGTVHQYETFNKVARKGQLDDSIFDFTGPTVPATCPSAGSSLFYWFCWRWPSGGRAAAVGVLSTVGGWAGGGGGGGEWGSERLLFSTERRLWYH